jgi:hypothetical protein
VCTGPEHLWVQGWGQRLRVLGACAFHNITAFCVTYGASEVLPACDADEGGRDCVFTRAVCACACKSCGGQRLTCDWGGQLVVHSHWVYVWSSGGSYALLLTSPLGVWRVLIHPYPPSKALALLLLWVHHPLSCNITTFLLPASCRASSWYGALPHPYPPTSSYHRASGRLCHSAVHVRLHGSAMASAGRRQGLPYAHQACLSGCRRSQPHGGVGLSESCVWWGIG